MSPASMMRSGAVCRGLAHGNRGRAPGHPTTGGRSRGPGGPGACPVLPPLSLMPLHVALERRTDGWRTAGWRDAPTTRRRMRGLDVGRIGTEVRQAVLPDTGPERSGPAVSGWKARRTRKNSSRPIGPGPGRDARSTRLVSHPSVLRSNRTGWACVRHRDRCRPGRRCRDGRPPRRPRSFLAAGRSRGGGCL